MPRVIASTFASLSVNSAKQSPHHKFGDCFVANYAPRNDNRVLMEMRCPKSFC